MTAAPRPADSAPTDPAREPPPDRLSPALAAFGQRLTAVVFLRAYWMSGFASALALLLLTIAWRGLVSGVLWAVAVLPLLVAAARAALYDRGPSGIAMLLDQRAGLSERLITSWELRSGRSAAPPRMARLVHASADAALDGVDVKKLCPLGRDAVLAAAALAAAAALLWVSGAAMPVSSYAPRNGFTAGRSHRATRTSVTREKATAPASAPSSGAPAEQAGAAGASPGTRAQAPPAPNQNGTDHGGSAANSSGSSAGASGSSGAGSGAASGSSGPARSGAGARRSGSSDSAGTKFTKSAATAGNSGAAAGHPRAGPAGSRAPGSAGANGPGAAAPARSGASQPDGGAEPSSGNAGSSHPPSSASSPSAAGRGAGPGRAGSTGQGRGEARAQAGPGGGRAGASGRGSGRAGRGASAPGGTQSGAGLARGRASGSAHGMGGPESSAPPAMRPRMLPPIAQRSAMQMKIAPAADGEPARVPSVEQRGRPAAPAISRHEQPTAAQAAQVAAVEHDPAIPAGYRQMVVRYFAARNAARAKGRRP